jgi:large subunit ribosomal protein L25
MANQETLQAEKRDVKGTTASKRLRRAGTVPAIVYGSKQDNYAIQVNEKEFFDILRRQSSASFLVNLEIAGAKEKHKLAFVQDIQKNALSGNLVHVDFRAVSEKENIHAVIPITLEGEAIGMKEGGLLEHLLHSLEIECLPADLPERVTCNVEALDIGDSVKVGDITFPEGVTPKLDAQVLVALVAKQRVEEEPTAGAADAAAAEGEGEEAAEGGEEAASE